jgi:gliding motility-associated-like protein
MRLLFSYCLLILVTFATLKAQPPETNYQGSLIAKGFKQSITTSDGPYPIGFNFTFFGNSYSQFYVSANGLVMFVDPDGLYNTEEIIPTSTTTPNNFIAPFWDNLSISDQGEILYTTIGASPNRKCIIQFRNMAFDPVPTSLGSFSVILYETSNKIQIQYRIIVDYSSANAHGASASIGIENSDGSAGNQYAYHDPTAINTGQAISFTPSGPGFTDYTINSDAEFDGIYLTKNLSLPEPGITNLYAPPQDAVIGESQTFEWTTATNVTNYSLRISHFSDLTDATIYNTGTETEYDIAGLTLDTTYYWGVFASNATGTTWCEIKRFTTSPTPPLRAVPETDWIEQGDDWIIGLDHTGGDASTKSAIITSLPLQGALYQNNSGVKGSQITTVPANVTDPGLHVIYTASGGTGNGAGNFNFKVHDNTGDSPEVSVTVNVNAPGAPNFLYAARNGNTSVEIQFDRPMNNPSGKENEFTLKVGGSAVTIGSATLKVGDHYTIVLTPAIPLSDPPASLTVAYTQGTVTAANTTLLASFTDQTITLKSQTILFTTNLDKTYGASPFALSFTSTSSLAKSYSSSSLSIATISGSTLTIHAAGLSDITAQVAGDATYAPARYIRLLTVSKANQAITFPALPVKNIGDADFIPGATSGSGLAVTYSSDNTDVATIINGKIHIAGGGNAIITASQAGNTNYNPATDVPQTLTVNKINQTITFSSLPVSTYGDADVAPGASASSGLAVSYSSSNTDVLTITGGIIHIVGAGSAIITASQSGNSNYNSATDVTQTFTVNKANQTITFPTLPLKLFGDVDFDPGATASSGLTVTYTSNNISVAEITANLIHILSPGTTTIKANQSGNSNYNAAPEVTQTLTVNKGNQTISFVSIPPKLYGSAEFSPEATASSGLNVTFSSNNSAVATINNNIIHISGTGTTIITASQPGNDFYFPAAEVTQTLIVNKANLIFNSNNKTCSYLDPVPVLTYTITGFINGESQSDLDILPTIQTTASQGSPSGDYQITMTGGNDNNYNYIFVSGVLSITKIAQVITFSGYPDKLLLEDTYTLKATSSSGSTVSFESSDPHIASISGDQLTGLEKGIVNIRAYNSGDRNYNSAEAFAEVEIYSTHKDIMYLYTPNNDGFNDLWELPDLKSWGKCNVKVYNRWGKLVFSDPDYNNTWDGTSNGSPLPEGPYYFIIETKNSGVKKGTVNIVR